MDAETVTAAGLPDAKGPLALAAEESIDHLREHREEMALWLALEVLALNPVAMQDEELVSRLIACQERVEETLRAKAGRAKAGRAKAGRAELRCPIQSMGRFAWPRSPCSTPCSGFARG